MFKEFWVTYLLISGTRPKPMLFYTLLAGYGVGQYECSLTASGTEIVLVHTVFPCVHMKVTDNTSNIKKAFKFFDD